jgi:ubiquinone/menaquinone biosynthesis C-methylase UbiE
MNLNAKALALSLGTLCGVGASGLTVVLVLRGLRNEFAFLPQFLPGYSVSLPGAAVGFFYGFGIGFAGAGFFYWLFRAYQRLLVMRLPHGFSLAAGLAKAHSTSDPDTQKASQLWGQRAQQRQDQNMPIVAWTDSPLVNQLYIHPTISGVAEDNWLTWVSKKYFPQPLHRALSIGCGDGCLERHALQFNIIAQHFDAFDASLGAIEIARRKAEETGIAGRVRYVVADLNHCHLEPRSYEAAFSAMALHHIRELEHVLEQIRSSLKPGSLFILNEFVGPDQFQWTPTQVRLANEQLHRIPERYRKSLRSGRLKYEVLRPTRAEMTAGDPTESIRSSEILPLVSQAFEIVQRVDYGGTIVNLVLEEIAGNFQWASEDISILQMLFDAEKQLLREGVVPSDFTLIIARRPA